MELKTKYQYTYFIYPYIINENKYDKYILKLLNNKNIKVKFFEKEKDLDIYSYFLPTIKKFMFQGFEFTKEKIRKFEAFKKEIQNSILSKYPCTMFEYNLSNDIQGKAGEEDGIFFKIQKIQLVCFNTGICFLLIKTNIEDNNLFSSVLNLNFLNMQTYFQVHINQILIKNIWKYLQNGNLFKQDLQRMEWHYLHPV